MDCFIGFLKGRENFVSFMKAKQENKEWKSDLKEAIRRYEAADRLCTASTKTKRFYLLKSKIFKERLGDSSTQVLLVTIEICLRWYIQTYKDNIHLQRQICIHVTELIFISIHANSIRSPNKALSNCYYNLYSYSRAALDDHDQWFDEGFIKVSMI